MSTALIARKDQWTPGDAVLAGAAVFAVQIAIYGWWVFADVLLSDDYSFFSLSPDFSAMTTEFFRPFYETFSDWMALWAKASPGAIYWMKGLHLLLAAGFVALISAFLAHTSQSALAGIAVGLLVGTNPGAQINAVWLCITPQWAVFLLAAGIVVLLYRIESKRRPHELALIVAGCSAALVAMMFVYQLAPFYIFGLLAAYLVLTRDDWPKVKAFAALVLAATLIACLVYGVALQIAVASGGLGGRAALAADPGVLLSRLGTLQLGSGLHWFNLFLGDKVSAVFVAVLILAGAFADVSLSERPRERARRWAAAAILTLATLVLSGVLNTFQSARLYTPGAIGVAGMATAAGCALIRSADPRWRSIGQAVAASLLVLIAAGSNAATVTGFGQAQHAELQFIRAALARHDLRSLERVYLIPPDPGPHWDQIVNDPRHDMYGLRMSTYHPWTYEGIVRFALRYVDPRMRIKVESGTRPPLPSRTVAVVDMRPLSLSLYKIRY